MFGSRNFKLLIGFHKFDNPPSKVAANSTSCGWATSPRISTSITGSSVSRTIAPVSPMSKSLTDSEAASSAKDILKLSWE